MSKSGNLAALSAILTSSDPPTIYYAEDPPFLPRILVFYWPVHAVGSLASTSRIRCTILSAAGFKNYGAFSVAPSSSYYSAVHKLSEEQQRSDVHRAIAFALCRYFSEIPAEVKNALADEHVQHGIGLKWGQTHAAQVTSRISRVTNSEEIIDALKPFSKDTTSVPVDTVRPLASIRKTRPSFLPPDNNALLTSRFGPTTTPLKRTGSTVKKTPGMSTPGSKMNPHSPPYKYSTEHMESLRFKMCELVDTEDRYIMRLQDLIDMVATQGRTAKSISSKFSSSRSQKTMNAMLQFPGLLDQIKDLNLGFLDDVETAINASEDSALQLLDTSQDPGTQQESSSRDPIGIYAFAKVLLYHFPRFPMPYREYLDLHSQVSANIDQFLKEGNITTQQAQSLLMEPAQRISRYGLYIDTMMPHVPPTSTMAIRTLEKARKIIAEICEMEPAASTILDSLRIEHETKRRPLSPTKLLSGLTRTNSTIREAASVSSTTGTLKDRDTPRLLPTLSLSRSFSRKTKSRPGLANVLSEQDPDQANNINRSSTQSQSRSDENRPPTSSSQVSASSLSHSYSKRPTTSSSAGSGNSITAARERPPNILNNPSQSSRQGNSREQTSNSQPNSPGMNTLEHYKAQLFRLEEENYKLLQENTELKKWVRECRCGRGR